MLRKSYERYLKGVEVDIAKGKTFRANVYDFDTYKSYLLTKPRRLTTYQEKYK